MPPLNPFLAAFFKSSVVAQCSPVQHHILLVPLTDVLLTHRDSENGLPAAEAVASDEFLTSYVLRIPSPATPAAGKDRDAIAQNLRDLRGKAKQFSTLNGLSVVKDSFIYSSFRSTTQAQILNDATWYPDVFESRQWMLYFISRPLVGTWEEVKIAPARLIHGTREIRAAEQSRELGIESAEGAMPRKKDIRSFHDLLNHFPMIARQMQVGLERLFLEFTAVFEKPLPPPPSAQDIPDPQSRGPIAAATIRARSSSLGPTNGNQSRVSLPVTEDFYAEDDEEVMRAALETAVTAAIDLFQGVDKQQLSLLGATTDLTGPLVEKLIERYVTENLHHLLFTKLSLQARITYVRSFIFIDDVESGEMGYALSTFEAVLAYLIMDSAGLRKASRRNKALWEATKKGNMDGLRNIMEPSTCAVEDADDDDRHGGDMDGDDLRVRFEADQHASTTVWPSTNGASRVTSLPSTAADRFSHGSGLSHVPLPDQRRLRSRRPAHQEDQEGRHGHEESVERIRIFLPLPHGEHRHHWKRARGRHVGGKIGSGYYTLDVILQDMNNEDTTLLSAAIQLGQTELIDVILDHVVSLATRDQLTDYFFEQDIWGRSVGQYLFHAPHLISRIGRFIPWRQRDKNGQTPLFALCRSYDHADYYNMVEAGLRVAQETQGDGQPLHVDDHLDGKGNTLLHIIDPRLAMRILHSCDVDVNATNDKRFTALMVASKYGRYDMVRCLFADPRVDVAARELRGLTAVELTKDDDVRNKIDELGLFSMPAGRDGRITGVVRAYFVEDGSVRLVLKSAAPTDHDSYTFTTSRRSLAEFERLAHLLAQEHPASWIPPMADVRSPFQLPTKPSRALLRHIQARADWFMRIMLNHPTLLSTHEMLWEFFLVPELQLDAMEQRTRLKVESRTEKIKDEYEPVEDVRETDQFSNHAKDMVRSVGYSTKSVTRRANGVGLASSDLYDSLVLHRKVAAVEFLPASHIIALEAYVRAMAPAQSSPQAVLHTTLLAMQSTVQALLSALSRPTMLINRIWAARREADRNENAVGRSSRWPLGLLDETRQRLQDGKELRARKSREEAEHASRELRHTQQTVAAELAGWQDMHEKMGRSAIREFAKGMAVQERMRLDGMMQALRRVREGGAKQAAATAAAAVTVSGAHGQGG